MSGPNLRRATLCSGLIAEQRLRQRAGKPIQGGVRVKLPPGVTWESLAALSPDEIRQRSLLPAGFMPLPHVKQATGGQVFPNNQIDEIGRQEARNLRRFDVDLDLPDRFSCWSGRSGLARTRR